MKLFLIFYAVTGLLFILAICRAASRGGAQKASLVKIDFQTEIFYKPNLTPAPYSDEQKDYRKCA